MLGLASAAAVKQPNFLLVVVDVRCLDLAAEAAEIETPNIDALAGEGVTFTQFYVSVSCSPTRSMLMTGTDIYPDTHACRLHAGHGLGRHAQAVIEFGNPGIFGHQFAIGNWSI